MRKQIVIRSTPKLEKDIKTIQEKMEPIANYKFNTTQIIKIAIQRWLTDLTK